MRPLAAPVHLTRVENGTAAPAEDILVTEEPLEIRLGHGPLDDRREIRLSVTMRTPGHDAELALGFLFTEGLIAAPADLVRVAYCEDVKAEERGNVVRAELRPDSVVDPARWQRNFYTTSSCGVCGKSSIEAVQAQCGRAITPWGPVDPAMLTALPDRMRAAQTVFRHTGGIHAAALFDRAGTLLLLREDVGRHNAVDKVIGAALRDSIALDRCQLLVSGRAGFELVQKCVVAGIPLMAAVGAPSSLAVALARANGLSLVGFLRDGRFNSYAEP
ncbi:MAG: formate dehydrogenase accessory sulfurtransferase FdhD [Flavobacteriales bacterium]|nr:formate dehydrogenase accessory sulfurtransferase FdhD [Flavobacteriales bacterium]MBK7942793.1 formate dehydrogenase accessory sulfurtransferase FdhD [Flavobacteriales bacterium]MBK9698804.1 formate dehydrogenase accessory sulfurtransferase FdhD [Flavobacteriales bacterium]